MQKTIRAEALHTNRRPIWGFIQSRRQTIVEIISALFILLFLYTAINKSMNIQSTARVLAKSPFFPAYSLIIAWTVVIMEYVVAAMLFFHKTRKAGLYLSFWLMAGFTAYIAYMKAFVPDLPCSCGGVISGMTWNQHLVFNIFFTLLALAGIYLTKANGRRQLK